MHVDPFVSIAGLLVGFVMGLTGMGGGALMTPILVLLFGIEPLAAVSSDIVASMVMKPVGGAVHWGRGTVHRGLVLWLAIGSVPSAFLGVLLLKSLGSGAALQGGIKVTLGVALLAIVGGLTIKPLLRGINSRSPGAPAPVESAPPVVVKRLPTVLIGMVGGLVVGMASVGSGSLIIVLLLLLYPRIRLSELVGTDLVQACPLVASAALGHFLFGDFRLALTASILIGSLPGVYLGARFSSRAPDHVIRPALTIVLSASALKLLGVSNGVVGAIAGGMLLLALAQAALRAQRERGRAAAAVASPAEPAS